jgi:hypothetical protein
MMDVFHCDMFEMRIRFEPHEMNVKAFLEALSEKGIKAEPDEDGDTEISLTFPCADETVSDYHAHLTVNLWKSGRGKLDLSYHRGGTEKGAVSPASVNDCGQWLGSFFTDKVTAHIHVNYTFGKSFAPAITLNFPLVTSDKALAGALVSGLALVFPNDPKSAIIQSGKNETYLFVREVVQMDLKEFSLNQELGNISQTVNNLVKKTDGTD